MPFLNLGCASWMLVPSRNPIEIVANRWIVRTNFLVIRASLIPVISPMKVDYEGIEEKALIVFSLFLITYVYLRKRAWAVLKSPQITLIVDRLNICRSTANDWEHVIQYVATWAVFHVKRNILKISGESWKQNWSKRTVCWVIDIPWHLHWCFTSSLPLCFLFLFWWIYL